MPFMNRNNRWQQIKDELQLAINANQQVAVQFRLLYDPSAPQEPEGVEIHYRIGAQSYTRTFRGMPEGFDVAIQAK